MKPIKAIAGIAVLGAALWACTGGDDTHTGKGAVLAASSQTFLPQDVFQSCTLTQSAFNQWFTTGSAGTNGRVMPANSVNFKPVNNCAFYQWSEQMFLWMMSPADQQYGGKGIVLESPVFYDVSPEDSNKHRHLIPHLQNHIFNMAGHIVKDGPHRLPVVRDVSGRLFELVRQAPANGPKAMLSDAAGRSVEISSMRKESNGQFSFFDKAGKPVQAPRPKFRFARGNDRILQELVIGNDHVFLDFQGNQVQVETGQATGDALMSQNGSLVYYLSMVNDVYAFFLTGAKNNQIGSNTFPISQGARDSICALARARNVVLPDSNALAMEIKSSWVEASTLSNPGNYITVMADIPKYDTSSNTKWLVTGTRRARMALVGIHIVGSVAGHPEMVWATFEHNTNAPNAAFQYLDSTKKVQTVKQQSGTGWLFASNSSDSGYNVSHMTSASGKSSDSIYYTDFINAQPNLTISASNTLRTMPWGSAMDSLTNQQDLSSAASNSEVISINNAILNLLPGNDIRKNYLFMGAEWTFGGAPPTGNSYGADTTHGVAIGTSALANSTMETYFQGSLNVQGSLVQTTCFFCHSDGSTNLPASLSHIYGRLDTLPPAIPIKK